MAHERPEDDIDTALQAECEAKAAELGISVDDYVSELLLQTMLRQHAPEPAPEPEIEDPAPVPLAEVQHARQRLESIDRRLTLAAGNFESMVESIDRAVAAISARTDDSEVRAERLGARVEAALFDLREAVDQVDGRATIAEQKLETLAGAHEAAQAEGRALLDTLAERLVEELEGRERAAAADRAVAREQMANLEAASRAEFGRVVRMVDEWRSALRQDIEAVLTQERAARDLTDARLDETQQTLTHMQGEIQSDLRVVEARTEQRLSEQGAQARAALEAASQRAERVAEEAQRSANAAAHRATTESRAAREAIEQRLIETAADVHARIDATRAETAKHYETITEKLCDVERSSASKIAEARGQTEALGAGLNAEIDHARQTLATTRAELTTLVEDTAAQQRATLETIHQKLDNDISDVRERHLGGAARLKLFEVSLNQLGEDVSALRGEVEARQQTTAAAVAEEFQTVHADIAQMRTEASASEERTANTVAALAARSAREHSAVLEGCEVAIGTVRTEAAAAREAVASEIADLRTDQKGALARLKLADEGLAAVSAAQTATTEKVQTLDARLERAQIEFNALGSVLRDGIARVNSRIEAAEAQMTANASSHVISRVDDVVARLDTQEAESADFVERASSLGRLVNKLSTQYMEAMTSLQERLHKLEVGLSDTRLARVVEDQASGETLRAEFEERLAAVERRSIAALEQLTQSVALLTKRNQAQAEDESRRTA